MENNFEMSEDEFIHIYNKLLMPNYQTLVPFDIKLAVKLTYEYAMEKQSTKLQVAVEALDSMIKTLEFYASHNGSDDAAWETIEKYGPIIKKIKAK